MSRYAPIPTSALPGDLKATGEQAENLAAAAFGENGSVITYARPDGALIGPFPVLIASKEVATDIWGALNHFSSLQSIPADAREVAMLVTAARFDSKYEEYAHRLIAIKQAGLTSKQCATINRGERPQGLSEAATAAYNAAQHLVNEKGPLPRNLYDAAVGVLGREGTLHMAHCIGICSYLCVLMNLDNTPLPSGEN